MSEIQLSQPTGSWTVVNGETKIFRPDLIRVTDPIRRKQTKIKEGSQSRFKFQLWKSRAYRRQGKSEHFSNVA